MVKNCIIALVTDQPLSNEGGRESTIIELSRAIARSGNEVKIIAPPSPLGREAPIGENTNVQYTLFPDAYSRNLIRLGAVDSAIYSMHNLENCVDPELYGSQVLYVHDVEEIKNWAPGTFREDQPMLANSQFVARSVAEQTGIQPLVVSPIIEREKYETTLNPQFVTFINPVPLKGVKLAIAIAKLCPQIPFQFVVGWVQSSAYHVKLLDALSEAPNIHLRPWQADMRGIYASTKILLVPSQWHEGFGRVIVEAQISGIPVIASSRGGCPEAVGDGGVILAADAPAGEWAASLQDLWTDAAKWADLSTVGASNAWRYEAQQDVALERLLARVRSPNPNSGAKSGPTRCTAEASAKCSVIVTHYNYATFIKPLLDSLSTQTHANFSCVIVDDCSRVDEREALMAIVEDHGDTRCQVLALPENLGQIPAFFRGLNASDGDFISMIDPDDIYAPQFLELMLRAHLNPERVAAVAACEMGSFQTDGGPLLRFWARARKRNGVTGDIDGSEYRLAQSGYSLYYPPAVREWVWGTTASFMFRRDGLALLQPSTWNIAARYDLDTYCAGGLHSLGGTLFVDRVLSWRGRHDQNIAFTDKIFSQHQNRNNEGAFGLSDLLNPEALRAVLSKLEPLEGAPLTLVAASLSRLTSEQIWTLAREHPAILAMLIEEKQNACRLARSGL